MMQTQSKFAELTRADQDHKKENAWFGHCQANGIPFITVRARTRLADVHWDYISYSAKNDEILAEHALEIRDSAINIFRKYSSKGSSYEANNLFVWYRDMDIDTARQAAVELHDLVAKVVSRAIDA